MAFTAAKPEILSPRTKRGGKMFDDENLDLLSHVLDDFIRIPGTSIRFGLDGIVGFIPGIGDLIGGIASCIIIIAAWVRGVSYVTVARMVANVAIEVVVGSIPMLGDMFDIAWRANRRNYALLTGSLDEPRKVHDSKLALSRRRSASCWPRWSCCRCCCLPGSSTAACPRAVRQWIFTVHSHGCEGCSRDSMR